MNDLTKNRNTATFKQDNCGSETYRPDAELFYSLQKELEPYRVQYARCKKIKGRFIIVLKQEDIKMGTYKVSAQRFNKLKEKGVIIVDVLLHVGLGTFRPVKTEDIINHHMHSEYYEISKESANIINLAKKEGRRVIAIGTTSVRTLESACDENGFVKEIKDNTEIFLYPPYKFKCIDGLITNFHLPKSTLIMLVSCFSSREETLNLYKTAVEEKYRFFSFGDACMFL